MRLQTQDSEGMLYLQEIRSSAWFGSEVQHPEGVEYAQTAPKTGCLCYWLRHASNTKYLQNSPPIITHTAATPQDSPSTTLDEFPEFQYKVTTDSGELPSPSIASATLSLNEGNSQRAAVGPLIF